MPQPRLHGCHRYESTVVRAVNLPAPFTDPKPGWPAYWLHPAVHPVRKVDLDRVAAALQEEEHAGAGGWLCRN